MTKLTDEELAAIRDRAFRSANMQQSIALTDRDKLLSHISSVTAELSQAQAELAALRAGAPDGWKLVPIHIVAEQNAAMRRRYEAMMSEHNDWHPSGLYDAALAAAPQPPAQAVVDDDLDIGYRLNISADAGSGNSHDKMFGGPPAQAVDRYEIRSFGLRNSYTTNDPEGLLRELNATDPACGVRIVEGSAQAVAVRVKPLIFDDKGSAATPFGKRLVQFMSAETAQLGGWAGWKFWDGSRWSADTYESRELAIAAAQANEARRILSAIDARPEAAVKAEALREVAKYFDAEGQEEIEHLVAAGYQQCAAYCIDEADRLETEGAS